ncbi:MAG: hypothetical protein IH948_01965, partial [Bacteroidetes bacterium]|nr:hypothetical protein [Bacteroidota bacterium]
MDTLATGVAESTSITWALFALGAMLGWGFGQGFTKKFINDVTGTKFCLYFVFAVAVVNITMWTKSGAPNPFLTSEGLFASEFVYWTVGAYILNGIAWAAYFICIKYAPIAVVGT